MVDFLEDMVVLMCKINKYVVMLINDILYFGVFKKMVEDVGFENVVVYDFILNVKFMIWLFFVLVIILYLIVWLFGFERYFINMIVVVEIY